MDKPLTALDERNKTFPRTVIAMRWNCARNDDGDLVRRIRGYLRDEVRRAQRQAEMVKVK